MSLFSTQNEEIEPPICAAEETSALPSLPPSFYKRCFAKMSLAECSSLHNKRRFLSDGNGGNNAKNEVGMRPSVLSAKKEF